MHSNPPRFQSLPALSDCAESPCIGTRAALNWLLHVLEIKYKFSLTTVPIHRYMASLGKGGDYAIDI